MTIEIRPMHPDERETAAHVIMTVAHGVFAPAVPFEEFRGVFMEHMESLADLQALDTIYAPPDGLFLVAVDGEAIVGTGAICRLDDRRAEIKRMWLLEDYQGQGIGYRIVNELLAFARAGGYETAYLTTSWAQTRAIAFYEQVGFREVPPLDESVKAYGLAMTMAL